MSTNSIVTKKLRSVACQRLLNRTKVSPNSRDRTPRASPSARRAPSSTSNVRPSLACQKEPERDALADNCSKKRKAGVLDDSSEQQEGSARRSSVQALARIERQPPVSSMFGVQQRRQTENAKLLTIPFQRPHLGKDGVAQVNKIISKWIEKDPNAAEQLQIHHMELTESVPPEADTKVSCAADRLHQVTDGANLKR